MPRTRSLAWSELKIGVLTIVALVIAAVTDLPADGRHAASSGSATRSRRASPTSPASSPARRSGWPASRSARSTDVDFVGDQVDVDVRGQQGRSAPRSRPTSIGEARLGVAARRERRRHHAVGHRARRFRSGATCRPGKPPAQLSDVTDQASQGIDELTALINDIRDGQGHGRQADDRRAALRRAQPVRRDGRRRDRRASSTAGARSASWSTTRRPPTRSRPRSKNLEDDDAPDQRRRGQPRQAAERRRVREVADRRDDQPRRR